MSTLRPTIRARRNPSSSAIDASLKFQAPRDEEFFRMDKRKRLAERMGRFGMIYQGDNSPSQLMEKTRHWMLADGIADHRAAGQQTFRQAFEAVYGETLE